MSKERDAQVLKNKIAELELKITNNKKYNISEKKNENLKILKLKLEDQLEEIEIETQ
jgi:hypothetical protein